MKMNRIELVCDTDCDFSKIELTIDGEVFDYTQDQNSLIIEGDIPFGLHYLKITLIEGKRFSCKEVRVNAESLRVMKYLSWVIDNNGVRHQPGTTIWEPGMQWFLPFGNPVSWWYSLVYSKIPNSNFGTDFSEKFDMLWPESLTISERFPASLRTFFKYNFDFYCKPTDTGNLPWHKLDLELDQQLVSECLKEIDLNKDWIFDNKRKTSGEAYSAIEFSKISEKEKWHGIDLIDHKKNRLHLDKLPNLHRLVETFPINDIDFGYLGVLPPGSFIVPHIDDVFRDRSTIGPYNIYVPLQWSPGNHFKFASGGLLPASSPCLINPGEYTHALVNDSEHPRYILTFILDINKNQHLLPASHVQTKI